VRFFFDKATTITRILGYYIIIDKIIYNKYESKQFVPYEMAISEARGMVTKYLKSKKINLGLRPWEDLCKHQKFNFFKDSILNRQDHPRYWSLVYTIFFGLSWLCVILSSTSIIICIINMSIPKMEYSYVYILFAIILTCIVSYDNLRTLYELREGVYSDRANRIYWQHFLEKCGFPDANSSNETSLVREVRRAATTR
jgi:hypothetical protein